MKLTKKYKKQVINHIDIEKELSTRGIDGKLNNDNLMVVCPFHNDRNPSMGVKTDGERKGLFRCMTFNCQEKGDFFELISKLDSISYLDAFNIYAKGIKLNTSLDSIKSNFKNKLHTKKKSPTIRVLKKSVLEKYKKPYGKFLDYLKGPDRKLNLDIIGRFELLCCDSGRWKDRVIVPIYDERDRLISLAARAIHDTGKRNKIRKKKNTDRSKVLFGLERLKSKKQIVIVEGEFDVIYLQQFNVPAVSLGTTSVSRSQINKIVKNCDKVFIALDGDVSLKKVREIRDQISGYVPAEIVKLPKDKDPNELTQSQVKKIFKHTIVKGDHSERNKTK